MKTTSYVPLVLSSLIVLNLVACGGGDGGNSSEATPSPEPTAIQTDPDTENVTNLSFSKYTVATVRSPNATVTGKRTTQNDGTTTLEFIGENITVSGDDALFNNGSVTQKPSDIGSSRIIDSVTALIMCGNGTNGNKIASAYTDNAEFKVVNDPISELKAGAANKRFNVVRCQDGNISIPSDDGFTFKTDGTVYDHSSGEAAPSSDIQSYFGSNGSSSTENGVNNNYKGQLFKFEDGTTDQYMIIEWSSEGSEKELLLLSTQVQPN